MSTTNQDLERQVHALAAITPQVLALIGSLGVGERSTVTALVAAPLELG